MAHVMGGIQWALQASTTRAFNPSASVGNATSTTTSSSSSLGSTGTGSANAPR